MVATSCDRLACLEVAGGLAREIAESAVWWGGRCNWIGAVPRGPLRPRTATTAALGPDLYGGTSGVALFLAEAGAALDDDRLRATALASIRLALDHAGGVDPQVRDGLYAGPVGVAHAAIRIAGLLSAEDVMARAGGLLADWRDDGTRSRSSEVTSGCAGAVLGLVAISPLVEEPWLIDTAVRLGDELIVRAEVGAAGWSWAAPGEGSMHNLCGYAHGAAGIAHALAELFGATGERRFRAAALHAFDYERSWLDARSGTWPDLRGVGRRAGRDVRVPASDSWCNGAPGIALSRLRAAELFASERLRRDAGIAVAATERHAGELLVGTPDDFSLCHGAAGAADVLLQAGGASAGLSSEVGRVGIGLYRRHGASGYPCGVPLGDTPGLLLGYSGIGMLYLRLSGSPVRSPLLVHRSGG